MNASSTHDTKRSEDVRARLQVLTEMPQRWNDFVGKWLSADAGPDANERYLIYQTLLGVWPLHWEEEAALPARLQQFLQKALREAKLHSSWAEPKEAYERAVWEFTDRLLHNEGFLSDFRALHADVAWYGALNSLAQLVIRLAAPGLPDIYQGNETWQFALVDPDNRRPVDYGKLQSSLAALPPELTPPQAADLLPEWRNGLIKMLVTRAGLQLRRELPELFAVGDYIPLVAHGKFARHVVAFARRLGSDWVVAVTGRFYSQVGALPLAAAWGDTVIELPSDAPRVWHNALTNEHGSSLGLQQLFNSLPFALLVAKT